MTVFDFIANIIFNKSFKPINLDEENEFIPFMVNRWLSMYSPKIAQISNKINKYLGLFDSKQELYKLFVGVFPSMPVKKINYFKKNKDINKDNDDESIVFLAKSKELSIREIKEYVELKKVLVKS